MKTYLSKLSPSERRFVVGVAVVFFLVVNIFWVWPHFSDWQTLKGRLIGTRAKLANYQAVIQQSDRLKAELAKLESEGAVVPAEDQAIEFMRTIQMQAGQSGMGITSFGHQTTRTNQFFSEQSQTISGVSGEKQLVDFLYHLGSGSSLVRVRAISVHPDQNRQQLSANITLVASYQKNQQPQPVPAATRAPAAKKTPPTLKVAPAQTAPPPAKNPPAQVKLPATPAKPVDLKPATPKKK
jgi:Tfp pilus assembly protein PilO